VIALQKIDRSLKPASKPVKRKEENTVSSACLPQELLYKRELLRLGWGVVYCKEKKFVTC